MLQADNLLLALAIVVAAYAWYRVDFRMPRLLPLPARTPRLVLAALGWTLVVWITVVSVGGMLAGRTQVAKSGIRYASLEREPARFWREIALQTLVVAGTGAILIVLSRRPGRHRCMKEMNTLTIQHQDGDLVYRLDRGGYAVEEGTITISVETLPVEEDQFPERALFSLVDAPIDGALRMGMSFHARSISGDPTEGAGDANAYFSSHADDVTLRWTVREATPDHAVFELECVHDDVDYYDERARPTTTTGLFRLAHHSRDQLWAPA